MIFAGAMLRQLLGLNGPRERRQRGFVPLPPDREKLYKLMEQELEMHSGILAIALNDAIGENKTGNHDIAWRLVRLSAAEWTRVSKLVSTVHETLAKHLHDTAYAVPVRKVVAQSFKSAKMVDYFRMHELLDQLVFRSRMRFQLRIKILRRAVETLTVEFNRTVAYGERTDDRSPELWSRLDFFYHDLDLLGKESLLALRAFLASLPDAALPAFGDRLMAGLKPAEKATDVQIDA